MSRTVANRKRSRREGTKQVPNTPGVGGVQSSTINYTLQNNYREQSESSQCIKMIFEKKESYSS